MEAQRQYFLFELEYMGGKTEQFKLEVKALKILGQQVIYHVLLAKAVTSSVNNSQEKRERE